jgi:signal recognition particle-docking protein FtsY
MLEKNNTKSLWSSSFSRLRAALSKTKEAMVGKTPAATADQQVSTEIELPAPQRTKQEAAVVEPAIAITKEYLEELEDKLIRSDLGLPTVNLLMDRLRKNSISNKWTEYDVRSFLKNEFSKMLAVAANYKLKIREGVLNIILVVGVNGTGKTTSIGKLCHRLRSEGAKVLIAAGDTFRAAAESQLEIWAQRAACDLVRLAEGSDPGAVVYQAIEKAYSENYTVLVIDTAGRLHNKANLMAELRKIQGVIDKNAGTANFEALLVLDASTGQNGIQQARLFSEVCPLTGVILTKLDGTAKGGVVFSIANELKIPVKLIGLGEKIDDLQNFEPELFIDALFA